ncbi:Ig-like domain-containing protein [Brevibacillus fluminis]|uniref:Ig-like domain-containing protein n=1 Tax=Brevibacillus fluminis TaxID=511487 RepID=UPI003F89E281
MGAHKFSGLYGNDRGIDTWTYFPGETVTNNLIIVGQGQVTGQVFQDTNRNGMKDSGEPGISGVGIEIEDAAQHKQTVQTGTDGTYTATVETGSASVKVDIASSPIASMHMTTGNVTQNVTVLKNGTATADAVGFSPNQPPQTVDASKDTTKNTPVSGAVTASDADGDALTYSVKTDASNGTVTVNPVDGSWTYTPNANYVGPDSFTVEVSDGKGGTTTSTITITVNAPENQAPTVGNDSKTTTKNTPVSGTVTASDADEDTLTYSVKTDASNGTVTVNPDNGSWMYTPNPDYVGPDTFTVEVSDGKGGTATSTITITINGPENQAPTVGNDSKTILKNTQASGAVVGTDADEDTLTYSVKTDASNGTVTVNPDNGSWTYTPNADYVGPDTFTVEVSDGKGGTTTSTITITINGPENQAPTVGTDSKTTAKNTPVSGTVTASDADGDTLTYSVKTNADHGTVTVNPADGSWTYTPNANYVGLDTFTVEVSDGKGGTATSTITITINGPENQAPTVGNDSKTTTKNTPVSGTVTASDADEDTLTYSVKTDASNGTVTVNPADGSWTYTPTPDYVGPDTFTVEVSDGKGGTVTSTITITINGPENQAPTVGNDSKTTTKNTPVSGTVTASDADGDALTYSVKTDASNGTVTVNPADGSWTYTPNADYVGPDTFTVEVSDGKGGTVTSTITITINAPENQAPTVGNDSKTTTKNTPVSGTVTASDADEDTLTYSVKTDASNGTVTLNPAGSWTYTPNTDFTGTDSFAIEVSDGKGGKVTSRITIEVTAPDTPPAPVNHEPTVPDYTKKTAINEEVDGVVEASDADGDTLAYSLKREPEHGEASVSRDGSWTYSPDRDLTGTDSFQVKVSDGKGGTAVSTITILVVGEQEQWVLHLTAAPKDILGDGVTTSQLTATLQTTEGKPVARVPVSFTAEAGTLAPDKAVTDKNGHAVITLTSPLLEGIDPQLIHVTATATDEEKHLSATDQIAIRFLPAELTGIVVDEITKQPIAGARVRISEDFDRDGVIDFEASVQTDENGLYRIAVPRGNYTYTILISTERKIGNATVSITTTQSAQIGGLGGAGEQFTPTNKITGQLLVLDRTTNKPVRPDQLKTSTGDSLALEASLLNDDGGSAAITISPTGLFEIANPERNKQYEVLLSFRLPNGEILAGNRAILSVNDDGMMAVHLELIDPFGAVTDADTGKVIKGATVKLHWADTALNKQKGRVPGELVSLPALDKFPPESNANPQSTDSGGRYAWMVYGEGDYYLTAEKSGYQTYDSREEGRNVAAKPGESSYVKNGIIHVGQTIVEYDFSMEKEAEQGSSGSKRGKEDHTEFANTVEGDHYHYIMGYPDGTFKPERTVTRAEMAAMLARLTQQTKPSFDEVSYHDVAPTHWAYAYIELMKKESLMTGYADGNFYPNQPMTRAEMAVVLTRFMKLKVGHDASAKYADSANHWAKDEIEIVTREKYMIGYPDNSFGPDHPITRAETVTTINRMMGFGPLTGLPAPKWPDVSISHWAYNQIEEASRSHRFRKENGTDSVEIWKEDIDEGTW